MSGTAEIDARREYAALTEPDRVYVKVPVRWYSGFCLPVAKSDKFETAVFETLTFGTNLAIEKAVSYEVEGRIKGIPIRATDVNEYRRLIVKKNLVSWSLNIPIERENGWLTPECYQQVSKVPAPLMEAFLDEFEESISITKKDEEIITRQASVLFGKDGKGVVDACEAVSLFCVLGNYWEKFGLNREMLPEVPLREYLLLKIMMGKEGDANRRNTAMSKPKAPTRIATAGGRVRQSRGIVVGRE